MPRASSASLNTAGFAEPETRAGFSNSVRSRQLHMKTRGSKETTGAAQALAPAPVRLCLLRIMARTLD